MRLIIILVCFFFILSCTVESEERREISFIVNSSCEKSARENLILLDNIDGFSARLVPISYIRDAYINEAFLGLIETTINTVTDEMLEGYANGALTSCEFKRTSTFDINNENDLDTLIFYLKLRGRERPNAPVQIVVSEGYIKIFEP